MYRKRLVAHEYSQVPGIDFSENKSPTVNDIMFIVLCQIMIKFEFLAKIVDVKMEIWRKKCIWSALLV